MMFWNDITDIRNELIELKKDLFRFEGMLTTHIADMQEASAEKDSSDKIYEYMNNVDKLNDMINEFKGCVSMARGALEERKKLSEQEGKTAVLADISQEIYKCMLSFIQAGEKLEYKAHYKIDAIYKAVCEGKVKEKKSHKRRKKSNKTNVSQDCESEYL